MRKFLAKNESGAAAADGFVAPDLLTARRSYPVNPLGWIHASGTMTQFPDLETLLSPVETGLKTIANINLKAHTRKVQPMKPISRCSILLTGASGGLGGYICNDLAAQGATLALVAYPGTGLHELAEALRSRGCRAVAMAADLQAAAERTKVIGWATREIGPIDVLINNAGVEYSSEFHRLTTQQIREVLCINLEAPMMLTRDLLPGMLERGFGRIINISSLAGKSGPACQESYAATKAALVAFTFALRATYRKQGVSSSVICPGFVETGIYSRIKKAAGRSAPALLAPCDPGMASRAVIRAINTDHPEVIVSRYPMRPVLAFNALFPRFAEWFAEHLGVNDFFRAACQRDHSAPVSTQSVTSPPQT
jgi:short-subunit dehydrogenase